MKHQEFKHVILLRCMSQLLAQNRHAAAVAARLLLGDERASLTPRGGRNGPRV